MAYTYTPHDWTTQEPITQEKMDHIEQGIAGAVSTANANTATIDSIEDQINTLTSNVSILQRNVGNNFGSDLNNIKEELRNARGDSSLAVKFDTIDSSITDATNKANAAVSAIKDTYEFAEEETLKDVIAEIKRTDDAQWIQINSNKASLDAASTGLGLAQRLVNIEKDIRDTNAELKAGDPDTVLSQKLAARDSAIAQVGTRIDNVNTKIENVKATLGYTASSSSSKTIYQMITDAVTQAQGYADNVSSTAYNDAYGEIVNTNNTLTDKIKKIATELNMIDSNNEIQNENTIIDTFKTYTTEIKNARGKDNDSLKDRLDGIDSTISEMDTAYKAADDAINNKLGTGIGTDANATGTTATAGKQLADIRADIGTNNTANTIKGRINTLENAIGTDDTSSTVKYRIKQLEDEVSAARGTGNTLLKNRLDNIDTTTTDLDARLDKIDGGSTLTGTTTLATRVSNTESAITTLNGNAGTLGSVLNTVNSRIAEVVNNAPKAFDTLKEIADWIGTHSSDVLTMQTNISNNANAISGLNTRLTAIDNDTTGRMKIVEDDIDAIEEKLGSGFDSTTGNTVADKIVAAANDATTKANAAENNAKSYINTQLLTKADATIVTNLSNTVDNISTTIVLNKSQVNFDSDNNPTTFKSGTIKPKDDYLIQSPKDDKYYYWRYINNEWELISGAGSSSGNNNAEDYATIAAFEQAKKELNKDYYVLDNNGFRHHYRYLSTATIAQPIEIGISPSLLKSYQIDTSEEVNNQQEQTQYLDFYGFDLGQVPTTINPEDHLSYRLAHIPLPKGGGESSGAYRIYAKVKDGQTRRMSYSDIQTNGLVLEYSYTCCSLVDGEYAYKAASWTLSTGGEIIESSNGVVDPLGKTIAAAGQSSYEAGAINIVTSNLFKYCQKNQTTTFNLTLHVETGENEDVIADRTISVYVTAVELSLTSTFSDQRTYNNSNNLQIPYTFIGMSGQEPLFEVLLDNTIITPSITSTDINIRSAILANLTGVHNLSIRASQQVSGATLYSNTLNYQLGLIDGQADDILIFSGASLENQLVEQYYMLKLPYYLYVPNNEEIEVTFTVEEIIGNTHERVASLSRPNEILTTGAYEYIFRIYEMSANEENYILTINAGGSSLVFNITARKAAEEINIKKENLIFDFKPDQFNNNTLNEEDRLWQYKNGSTTYKMRIPEGSHFDWRTGGWITVTEGNKTDIPCFCVKAGSRVEFVKEENGITTPLTLFWSNMESQGGSNFKCAFKIDNVKTPDAPFLTSLDNTINTVVNYGPIILSEKQDIEVDDTLLYNYLGVKYIYTKTINNKNKVVKEAIGTTVLNNNPFSAQLTEALRSASEVSARNKNGKKIKSYISNIYDIANQASVPAHREYLLKILSGKDPNNSTIDASTIKSEITSYLFDEAAYNANDGSITNTVAQQVYNTLVNADKDSNSIIHAYRQLEPVNFDALLNGFIVEGKDGKDGIIAMMLFTFESTIEVNSSFTQTVSATPISTNSFAGTGTFEVNVTDIRTNDIKKYEVEMINKNGVYTEIKNIRDASNIENKAYGLELNALGSNIYLPSGVVNYPYSEGDIIEFEYNVNAPIKGRINSSVIIYEDGVPSAAKLYTIGNNTFEQNNPGCLTIGSDDCDIYIYKMRLYDKALENSEILKNFYADGLTVDDMTARYNRNKNLVNAVKNNTITPQLVAEECPDLRVIMIEAPTLTGGKTSFIKNTKIRCIYKNGQRPEDNWVALNAYHAGQGTSSDNYGAAGRNLDIIFGFDGKDTVIIPKPQKNNYTFDPGYKSIVITGLGNDVTNEIKTVEEYAAEGYNVVYNDENHVGKISLTPTSVPNNWFNIKVNIASSENVNNAYLQKRFDRYLRNIYKTPAQIRGEEEGILVKNDMEFFNCVIFIKETGTASEFTEDNEIINPEDRPWHFYGIGNIGDSKKTDSTRVNIPGDPNEFAIEISDNGLLLSGFNTGVFYISEASKIRSQTPRNQANGNADIPEASAAQTGHICINGEYTVSNNSYTFSITNPNTTTMYFVPVSGETYYRRFMYVNNIWTEVGEPISFSRTSYGIKYPISQAEWTVQNSENKDVNTYHSALYDFDSGKGWDKSFEFRYDLTTKDGETVARTDTEAALNAQRQRANKLMFAKLYSWIVTASNEAFKEEFDIRSVANKERSTWFIKQAPLYWYLFTERYTMIDSRAKNTFYHCGKVYITEDEAAGTNLSALQAALIAAKEGTDEVAIENAQTAYNVAKYIHDHANCFKVDNILADAEHNNGYRFDLWDYDDDTALGINNNGQMVFSAGLEDIDKDITGWIYNEAESVIWRRIRENTYSDLGALYVSLKSECFNAENLIQEFDMLQNQFPEELWRMDFERKYYRPFYEKNETTYLNDMANGRKRYQRRQFERNMAVYINSKYQRNGSYEPNDLISFRPQFDWRAGLDTTIIIKPYSTMYINFALGNYDNTTDVVSNINSALSVRVNRGEEYRIEVSNYINEFRNIQCIIYNASRLMSIEGLGKFYCQQFILGAAKKLTTLILGNSDPDYTNRSMDEIGKLGLSAGLPLLETLDLQNIEFQNAPETFALENFPLLKNLNANGCNIRSFTFKDGGMLEKVTFPSGLTKINFKNLYNLVDKTDEDNNIVPAVTLTDAANLISYNSENSYSNSYEIVKNMLNNAGIDRITSLKLNDINWVIDDIKDLEPLKELKNKLQNNMSIAGTIKVLGYWSTVEIDEYTSIWPGLKWDVSSGHKVNKTKVIYKTRGYQSDEGWVPEEIITTDYIKEDEMIPDIYYGVEPANLPKRDPTIANVYQFGTINQNKYVMYSGWTLDKDSNNPTPLSSSWTYTNPYRASANIEEITLYTLFNTSAHKYTVNWYLKPGQLVKSESNQDYGKGYNLQAPLVSEIRELYDTVEVQFNSDDTVTYSIFDGWEKLPTNISPSLEEAKNSTYNIYGKWYTQENVSINDANENGLFSQTAIPTLEQLLVFSRMNNSNREGNTHIKSKTIVSNKKFNYQMGFNGTNNNGTVLVNTNKVQNFDEYTQGDYTVFDGIKPFSTNNGFTIAIDYQFNSVQPTTTNGSVLVGCYDKVNGNVTGFALYNNTNSNYGTTGPTVGYGNMFSIDNNKRTVGRLGSRAMVVIRHPANTSQLWVYSSRATIDNGSLSETINIPEPIELSTQTLSSNAVLCLGHLRSDLSTNSTFINESNNLAGAYGTIYWAKYWDEDLGEGECEQLANWPHENMTAIIAAIDSNMTRIESNNVRPSLYLVGLNASSHGVISTSRFGMSNKGWDTSLAKQICDKRVFNGLPIRLQSILSNIRIGHRNYTVTTDDFNITAYSLSELQASLGYIYLPSISSLDESKASPQDYWAESIYERNGKTSGTSLISDITPYSWLKDNMSIKVYDYYTASPNWREASINSNYYNLRFINKPINWSTSSPMNIYRINLSSIGSSETLRSLIPALKVGDIVILNGDAAYMYISIDDLNSGLQIEPQTGIFNTTIDNKTEGGWIKSQSYTTRSVSVSNSSYNNFIFINALGSTIIPDNSNNQPGFVNLNYAFTI